MKRIFISIAVLIFISGCATTENYKKIMETWVGSHVDRLVASWGPPQNYFPMSDGGMVLEYNDSRTITIPGRTYTEIQMTDHEGTASARGAGGNVQGTYSGTSTTYVTKRRPDTSINKWCTTRVIVDSHKIITKLSWEGNDCIALPPK
jgi:hypothetical protein